MNWPLEQFLADSRDLCLAGLGPGLPKSSLLRDRSATCSQGDKSRVARAALDRVARPTIPEPLINASALGRLLTEALEEIVHQVRGLILGVKVGLNGGTGMEMHGARA